MMTNTIPQVFLSNCSKAFEDRGIVLSKKRKLILEAFAQKGYISDIEEFWLELRNQHHISWATYYNFIRIVKKEEWLVKKGEKITLNIKPENDLAIII